MAKSPRRCPQITPRMIKFGSLCCALPSPIDCLAPNIFICASFDFHLERRVLRDSFSLPIHVYDPVQAANSSEASKLHSNSNSLLGYSRCLAVGHLRSECSNEVRCPTCHNYGHVQRKCLTKAQPRLVWMPKQIPKLISNCQNTLDSRARVVEVPMSVPLPPKNSCKRP